MKSITQTIITAIFLISVTITAQASQKQYLITDFGAIGDSKTLNTKAIQKTIDTAHKNGGGTIIIPKGTFLSGAIFFKPNTNLIVQNQAMLKGSDDIINYPKQPSRMEGQSLDYFPALVNAYNVDNFSIHGPGTIDGNGLKFWKQFWKTRQQNPNCTNLEVSRPRLVFIWNCDNVLLKDIKLHNSGFWTTHLYQCNNIKIINADIRAPKEPVRAPSSDGIDLDVCTNVLIKDCYISVDDDAIVMKGGKGPNADKDPTNGPVQNVIIENCTYGWSHAMLTCGSESIHSNNIIMRNCTAKGASVLLRLKLRPDTPQLYENITIENITGNINSLLFIKPWNQFFDLKDSQTPPASTAKNITLRNIDINCKTFAVLGLNPGDTLSNFTLENIKIQTKDETFNASVIDNLIFKNVIVNGKKFSPKQQEPTTDTPPADNIFDHM